MAAAAHIDVPLSLVDNAINSISLNALNQAAYQQDPNDPSTRQLQAQLETQVNNMGALYRALVETHKQRSLINGGSIEYSSFGLDYYEQSPIDRFQSTFRGRSSNWPSPADRKRNPGWLPQYLRNSIAHNHTSVQLQAGYLDVTVANSQDGRVLNFELSMAVKDYIRLIAHSAKDHIDKCSICAIRIEGRQVASGNLKIFLQCLRGVRESEKGQVKVKQRLNMPA